MSSASQHRDGQRVDGQPVDRQEAPSLLNEGHFRQILNIADDAVISVDRAQRIVLFNQGAERIFGYAADEVLGRELEVLLPHRSRDVHREHIRDFSAAPALSRRMGERNEIAGRRKDGSEFPAEASISKVSIEGLTVYTVILRDITSAKAAEERIRNSLRDKEVLLQEIHHRVKNNLQVISSLLSLQSRGIDDKATQQRFRESQHRVQSMALIHEQLYESESLSAINFPDYLRQLAAHLFRSYQVSSSRIELETDFADVEIPIDAAVPCGLILNELLSNALKYAFPDGRDGRVRVDFRPDGLTGRVMLKVSDNGIGMPPEVGLGNAQTLGLRLVRSLVQQLRGEVAISRSQGTAITVSFDPAATEDD